MFSFDQALLVTIGAIDVRGLVVGTEFTAVTADSRNVTPGSVFVAIQGGLADGHMFAQKAVNSGALAVVCEDPAALGDIDVPVIVVPDSRTALAFIAALAEGNPTHYMALFAIVGTDGKTSTAMILESGMLGCGMVTGLLGTIQYSYAGRSVESKMTTPDQVDLQKLFADMRDAGVEAGVMEVSSHAIEQRRVEACRFTAGVFTNLGRDHLDYHKTIDAYREAKLRFFTEVLPMNPDSRGIVVNDDDPVSTEIRRRCSGTVIGWTMKGNPVSELRIKWVEYSFDGTEFEVETPWGVKHVHVSLIGAHNVANIVSAIGIAGLSGWDIDRFITGIESLKVIPGRLESVSGKRPLKVFVDYAHTPRAVESVLEILRGIDPDAHLHVVCGAGGDRDAGKRPIMGRAAVNGADTAWITSDNPRSEDPAEIVRQVVAGIDQAVADGDPIGKWHVEVDRKTAITNAIRSAADTDVILIAGKGHETYQVLKDRTIHFSDVEVALEALEVG